MISKNEDDGIFDTLLSHAVIENNRRELSALPSESELATIYRFSDLFEAKIKRLFTEENRRYALKRIYKFSRRTAVALIIALGLLFSALMMTPTVRAAVVNVIVKWFEEYTRFNFGQKKDQENKMNEYRPRYLPDGFEEDQVIDAPNMTTIVYKNDSQIMIYFTYAIVQEGYSISVDNENTEYSKINIHGMQAYLFKAESSGYSNILIWQSEDVSFKIVSEIDVNDLIKMAENIYKK